MGRIRYFLYNAFGSFGAILFIILKFLMGILPAVMIADSWWGYILIALAITLIPPTSLIFQPWGLVCAINGPQDVWAILYYIGFAVLWLPLLFSYISDIVFVILVRTGRR